MNHGNVIVIRGQKMTGLAHLKDNGNFETYTIILKKVATCRIGLEYVVIELYSVTD